MPEQSDTPAAPGAATPVTLWREIAALDDPSEFVAPYREAIRDVLAILERRGHSEHGDPLVGMRRAGA